MTVMTNYEKHNRDLEKWEAAKRDLSTELQKANREIERLERVAELAKRAPFASAQTAGRQADALKKIPSRKGNPRSQQQPASLQPDFPCLP